MKAYITLLLLLPILLTSCHNKNTTDKGLLETFCENSIDGLDMLQFYVHPSQFVDMARNFNGIFYIDTSKLIPVKLGPHSEIIPISELNKLINFTVPDDYKKGVKLMYGYDPSSHKKMFIMYQPVKLHEYEQEIQGGFTYAKFTAESVVANTYYVYKWNSHWDTLNGAQFTTYHSQYATTVKYKKHDGHFRMLNIIPEDEASDAAGITFPIAEIDTLISHNNKYLLHKSPQKQVESIEFSSGAKNNPQHPWESHYKHIILMRAVANSAPTQQLALTGAAANMGSLCPPNCIDKITFLKATGCN